MRKLITVLVLSLASVGASAGGHGHFGSRYHHGHHGHHSGHRNDWVAPLILGGVVTYALTRPQQPVIVQQQPQMVPQAPYGYRYENILDANCNCYRLVLVPN
jgi:hypothetical protein